MPRKTPPLRRPLLDTQGAAEYTGFSPRQFKRWIEERTLPIPVVKVFGRNYFEQDDLDRLVESFPRQIPATELVTVARQKQRRVMAKVKR